MENKAKPTEAEVVLQALNILEDTGLSPRQLAEQNADLENHIQVLKNHLTRIKENAHINNENEILVAVHSFRSTPLEDYIDEALRYSSRAKKEAE